MCINPGSGSQPSSYWDLLVLFFIVWWPPSRTLFCFYCVTDFAAVVSHNVNIWYAGCLLCDPMKGSFNPQRGRDPQDENHGSRFCLHIFTYWVMSSDAPCLKPAFLDGSVFLGLFCANETSSSTITAAQLKTDVSIHQLCFLVQLGFCPWVITMRNWASKTQPWG